MRAPPGTGRASFAATVLAVLLASVLTGAFSNAAPPQGIHPGGGHSTLPGVPETGGPPGSGVRFAESSVPMTAGPWTYSVSNQSLGLPGDSPSPAAYDPATGETFIAEYPDLLVVAGAPPLGVVATITVGDLPSSICVLPSQDEVFVANSGSDNVSVVSTLTLSATASIPVGVFPSAIVYDNATGLVGVANELSLNVTWIDPLSLRATASTATGMEASAAAYNPSNEELLLTGGNASDGWPEVAWTAPNSTSISGALTGVGGGGSMAYDPAAGDVLVDGGPVTCACFAPDAVSVLNRSNDHTGTIPTAPVPEGIAYDPVDGAMLAVIWAESAWSAMDSLVVLYPSNFTSFTDFDFPGECPQSLAIDAPGDEALIANSCGMTLGRLSLSNGSLASVPVAGAGPDALLLDPTNGDLLIANEYAANLTVWSISSGRALRFVPVGSGPDAVTYDPISGDLYVANAGSDNVTVLDGATFARVASVRVGSYPDGLAFDPNDDAVWVANYASNNVTEISAASNSVAGTVPNEPGPIAIAYDGHAAAVYVADSLNGSLGVIHPDDLSSLAWDFLPGTPLSLAYDPGSSEIDVGEIGAIEYFTALRTDLVRAPATGLATIVLFGGVVGISDTTGAIVSNPFAGDFPYGIALDPATAEVLTANLNDDNVSVFASGTLQPVIALPSGGAPESIATNATSGVAVVGDFGSNALTVLRPSRELPVYALNFSETGLVAGTWSVVLDGFEHDAAAGTAVLVAATNGSYPYTILGPAGYLPNPASGTVSVAGAPVNVTIDFLPTIPPLELYPVTFTETGVCGPAWAVTVNGSLGSGFAGGPIVFHLPNGTYDFSVASEVGCRPSPTNGTFTVSGGPVNELVRFSAIPPLATGSGRWTPTLSLVLLLAGGLVGAGGGAIALWSARGRPARGTGPPTG